MLRPNSASRWLLGSGLAVVLSVYVLWDVTRPLSRGQVPLKRATLPGETVQQGDEQQQVPVRLKRAVLQEQEKQPLIQVAPEREGEGASTDERERVRHEAIRRADKRSNTLRNFHAAQPRNGWAQETEIELQRVPLPEGIQFKEVSCKADICRVVASGGDRYAIFDAVSGASKDKKTFSRQITAAPNLVTVEAFISPSDSHWPNPFADEGG